MKWRVYARLRSHCQRRGIPIAAFVEAMITDALDDEGEPIPNVGESVGYPKQRRESTEAQAKDLARRNAACFTF